MIFTEARFLLFFLAAFAVYWALPTAGRWRKVWLFVCSSVFYGAWDWRFLGLMYGSTMVDYFVARGFERVQRPAGRRLLMIGSLVVNLGTLALFKYYDFFAVSATAFFQWLGLPFGLDTLHLILPVGISFYTFQSLSYTIDCYRRELQPVRDFLDLAVFVSFFPQLVAGPIVRASIFLPQLAVPKRFREIDVRGCLTLFLVGYVKKACISDNVAPIVDRVFSDPAAWGAADLWLGALLYTVRIYCDFSGYSDMALATAGLFGYSLMLNFNFPYLASTITGFWRRWHISLSSWFRDYLYVTLGGNRRGPARTYLNLWIVFLLCGLWHGANWTFLVWGLYHGTFLVLERLLGWHRQPVLPRVVGNLYVLLAVVIGWVFFRAESLSSALLYLRGMAGAHAGPAASHLDPAWWLILPAFAAGHLVSYGKLFQRWWTSLPAWRFSLAYGAAVALMLPWVAPDYLAFIYFQF